MRKIFKPSLVVKKLVKQQCREQTLKLSFTLGTVGFKVFKYFRKLCPELKRNICLSTYLPYIFSTTSPLMGLVTYHIILIAKRLLKNIKRYSKCFRDSLKLTLLYTPLTKFLKIINWKRAFIKTFISFSFQNFQSIISFSILSFFMHNFENLIDLVN